MELVTHTPDFQHVGDKTCYLASKNSNSGVELVKRFFGWCFFMLIMMLCIDI